MAAGEFQMGAQTDDPQGPNFDPDAEASAGPPHRVELGAFFLSKYELTQGQYRRLTGHNPSFHQMGSEVPGDDSHPVEQVTIEEGMAVLARVGLTLPTEAQWEYRARAGTDSPWWSGRTKDSLGSSRAGNVLDAYAAQFPVTRTWGRHESFNDGFVIHAPVGRFAPNAFGLHDVVGNVWEPCLDVFGPYDPKNHRAGDGPGAAGGSGGGGAFSSDAGWVLHE